MLQAMLYDSEFQRRGPLPLLGASAIIRNNAVSTFTLDTNAASPIFQGDQVKGWHVRCTDGDVSLDGMFTSKRRSQDVGVREVSLSAESHVGYVERMICLLDPSKAITAQPDDDTGTYKRTGKLEDVVAAMFSANVGQTALAENKTPLVVEASQGRGKSVTINSRLENLLEVAQTAMLKDTSIVFESYLPPAGDGPRLRFRASRDLTREVRLSEINGSLSSFELEESAPEATRAIVSGPGAGDLHEFLSVSGPATDWGLARTVYVSASNDDEDEMREAGEEELADKGESASITLELVDVPGCRFGTDFTVGDKVTVRLADGAVVTDIVQSAEIEWSETGREIKLHVGPTLEDPGETDKALVKKVKALSSKLGKVEKR